jgi:hypothetical protein
MGNRLLQVKKGPWVAIIAALAIIAIYFIRIEYLYHTLDMRKANVIDCIVDTCEELNVPSALAISIFTQESRLKAGFKHWEPRIRQYAYDVPQILYTTAYAEGFRGESDELLNYITSIYWGVKHIKTLLFVYDNNICKAIMAYNAGDCVSGNYDYLDKVLIIYRIYYPIFECEAIDEN